MSFLRSLVFLLLAGLLALPGLAAQVSLSLATIRHPAFEADGVALAFDAARQGEADIRLARLRVAGIEYRQLRLHCSGFYFDGRRLDCPNGSLRRDDERGGNRPPLRFSLSYRGAEQVLEFALTDVELQDLSPLVKRLRGWRPAGRVDFRIALQGDQASLHLGLREVGFASKDGSVAGKQIAATLSAQAQRTPAGWDWQARLDWPQGELWRAPWRRQAGVHAHAAGLLSDAQLDVRLARLEVDGIGALTASLDYDRAAEAVAAWGFVTDRLDLATAMREWVQPWLAGLGFPAWQTKGQALFSAEWRGGALRRFYAGLEDASLADATGYVDLRGVNARIPWQAGAPSEAEFGVKGGRLGELPLGEFSFPLYLAGATATLKQLAAPLLDGKFEIDELSLVRHDDGWHGHFSGGIDSVSMSELSRVLHLPRMAGRLTARIPRVAYEKNVLALDGALAIQVFDGAIAVHRLRMIDPFSAGRRLLVDVTASNLDLGMLTRTFSFGSIAGRFDAELRDLEMAGWKPLRFAARINSSPGDYARVVSIGALRDIAAMGAGQAAETMAAIPQRSIGGFGYERIDVGCTLQDGVCQLAGGARQGEGIVLMSGRGFPAVNIIGYNPRIDWEALVARIREVIAGKPGVVIE